MAVNNYFDNNIRLITENSVAANNGLGCLIWQGARKGVYGAKKLTPPGHKSISPTVHRALYMCHIKSVEIPPEIDVSHVCHVNLCVNILHLVLEDHNINMGRLACKHDGVCSGEHHPPCLFAVGQLYEFITF